MGYSKNYKDSQGDFEKRYKKSTQIESNLEINERTFDMNSDVQSKRKNGLTTKSDINMFHNASEFNQLQEQIEGLKAKNIELTNELVKYKEVVCKNELQEELLKKEGEMNYLLNVNEELKIELESLTTEKSLTKTGDKNFEILVNKIAALESKISDLKKSKEELFQELLDKQDEIKQGSLYIEQLEIANSSQLQKIEEFSEILKLKELQNKNSDNHTINKNNDSKQLLEKIELMNQNQEYLKNDIQKLNDENIELLNIIDDKNKEFQDMTYEMQVLKYNDEYKNQELDRLKKHQSSSAKEKVALPKLNISEKLQGFNQIQTNEVETHNLNTSDKGNIIEHLKTLNKQFNSVILQKLDNGNAIGENNQTSERQTSDKNDQSELNTSGLQKRSKSEEGKKLLKPATKATILITDRTDLIDDIDAMKKLQQINKKARYNYKDRMNNLGNLEELNKKKEVNESSVDNNYSGHNEIHSGGYSMNKSKYDDEIKKLIELNSYINDKLQNMDNNKNHNLKKSMSSASYMNLDCLSKAKSWDLKLCDLKQAIEVLEKFKLQDSDEQLNIDSIKKIPGVNILNNFKTSEETLINQQELTSMLPYFRSKSNSKTEKEILTPELSPNDREFENKTIKSQNCQENFLKDRFSRLSEGNCNIKNSSIIFENYERNKNNDRTPIGTKYQYYDKDIKTITDCDEISRNDDSISKSHSLFDESYKLTKKDEQTIYFELPENQDEKINIEDLTKNEIEKIAFPRYTIESLRTKNPYISNNKDVEENSGQKDITEIDFLTGYGKSQQLYDSSSEDMFKFNQLRPNYSGCLKNGKYTSSLTNMVEIQDVDTSQLENNDTQSDTVNEYTNSQISNSSLEEK